MFACPLGVYGNVLRVKISQQDRGRAFIEMSDPAQAEEGKFSSLLYCWCLIY